jgi:DNA-binding response OmpR family regulator
MQPDHQQAEKGSSPIRFRTLIIDDDEALCEMTKEYLNPLGFEVHCLHSGEAGVFSATSEDWHAVILDVMLPDLNGFEVLRRIRKESNVPVLMLTALGNSDNHVAGLELGADDYVPKSTPSRELLARLRAMLRRAGWTAQETPVSTRQEIVVGDLRLDPSTHLASVGDKLLNLTRSEFLVLLTLVNAGGAICKREELSETVTGSKWQIFERSIDMHVSSLRKALRDNNAAQNYILTVRGVGYRFCHPSQPAA